MSDQEGLPGSTIYDIVQDNDGYIWAATNGGLCRFDGREFEVYENTGFYDNEILKVKIGNDGRMWVKNIADKFGYLLNGEFYKFSFENIHHKLRGFWPVKNGICLITSSEDNKTNILYYYKMESDGTRTLKGEILLGFSAGEVHSEVLTSSEGEFLTFALSPKTKFDKDRRFMIVKILEDELTYKTNYSSKLHPTYLNQLPKDISTTFLNTSNRVFKVENGNVIFLDNKPTNATYKSCKLKNEDFLISFKGRCEIFRHQNSSGILTQFHGFEGLEIHDILKDNEGNYWVGTKRNGIFVAPTLDNSFLGVSNGQLQSNYVYDIDGYKDNVYVTQALGNLNIFNEKRLIERISKIEGGDIRSIDIENGNVSLASDRYIYQSNVDMLANDKWYHEKICAPFANKKVIRNDDKLVLSSAFGVYLNPTTKLCDGFVNYRSNDAILNIRSYGLCYDQQNRLWIGSTKGIYVFDGNSTKKINIPDSTGLYNVTSIVKTDDNSIWAAVSGKGLYRISKDTIRQHYFNKNGFEGSTISTLYADADTLWIGSQNGLSKLVIPEGKFSHYSISSGLASNQINCIYPQGENLWVGTTKGVSIIPKSEFSKKKIQPSIVLDKILVNGNVISADDSIVLQHNENDIEISFIGFSYASRGRETYRYNMECLDTIWHKTPNRSVQYYGLPPGKYKFNVVAVSSDKMESEVSTLLQFEIKQLWWKRWWVQLLAVLFSLSIAYYIIQRRQANKLKVERKERDFQKRISELKMQALQSQMNPHFIFNTLNGIQDFLLSNETDKALNSLSDFSRMISFVFENSEKKLISLHQEIEFLNYYLALEKMRFEEKITVQFTVHQEIEAVKQDIFLPPLLIQPIIENAFQHGLHHKKTKSNLHINLLPSDEGKIKWEIIDDGVGRAKAKEFEVHKLKLNKDRLSSGLTIVTERVAIFHDTDLKNVEEFLKFTDLKDNEGKAAGTKVEVWL